MPLIVITGHPSSGKTHRANQIEADFVSRISRSSASESETKHKVVVVPSHHSSQDPILTSELAAVSHSQSSNLRDQLYNLSSAEKVARAEEFSAIKRALNKNDVVIADGLNYIKGFRYQLWCEAKAAATRCVVVHVAAREDECEQWNQDRIKAWGWDFPQEAVHETQKGEEMSVAGVKVRVGRNVMGELEPESHTAIYGDKAVTFDDTRSRSSSMGGGFSDSDGDEPKAKVELRKRNSDTMTLKSLYISDHKTDTDIQHLQEVNRPGTIPEDGEMSQKQNLSLVPVEPPPPKTALPYAPATLKSLLMRYEPPSPFTRWDTPLFTVPTSDAHPPYESIWTAIFPPPTKITSKKTLSQQRQKQQQQQTQNPTSPNDTPISKVEAVRQHAATILPKATTSDALQVLESSTADVVKTILNTAREQGISNGEGGHLKFTMSAVGGGGVTDITKSTTTPPPSASDFHKSDDGDTNEEENDDDDGDQDDDENSNTLTLTLNLPLNTPLSQPMLQRLRRKYTQIQRASIAHGKGYTSTRREIIRNFTLFLDSEWNNN